MKSILILSLLLPFSTFAKDAKTADKPKAAKRAVASIKEVKALHCGGTEPFYSVGITGNKMTFNAPEADTPVEYATSGIQTAAGMTGAWSSSSTDGKMIVTIISKQVAGSTCSDGMSETKHEFHMMMVRDGSTFYGCCGRDK